MYIAGRLRTASIPPSTLIEVASYLCPPAGEAGPGPLAAGDSLSPMSRASPQKTGAVALCSGRRSCGCARHLPCPLAPLTCVLELGLEGYSAPSRPAPKFSVGRGEAFVSPLRKGRSDRCCAAVFRLARLAQASISAQIRPERSAVQEESTAGQFY